MSVNPYQSPGEPPGKTPDAAAQKEPEQTDWLAHLITAIFVVPTLIALILMALMMFLMLLKGMG